MSELRVRAPFGGARSDARPLHEMVSDWAGRRHSFLEPCVCGGPDITAPSQSPEDVADAVRRHQIEPVHIAYDEAHGIPLASWQRRARAVDDLLGGS
jgi:hypothetical protein